MSARLPIEPVRKTLDLRCGQASAFERFSAGIAKWWPLAVHSVGGGDAVHCAIEPKVGGRVFERLASGSEEIWGTVLAFDPPRRLAFTWHPGRAAERAQEFDVSFASTGAGTTVELEHRGWEKLGEQAARHRADYNTGWDFDFGQRFRDFAEATA